MTQCRIWIASWAIWDRLTRQTRSPRLPRAWASALLFRFPFHQAQRGRINAVALPGGRRAVVEHVAQMRVATAAHHFGPRHSVRRVPVKFHVFVGDRLKITWPART